MMKNNTLKEIGEELINEDIILIFPHILMDGDALGSSVALCDSLRNIGKNASVVIEDKIPTYLEFLAGDYCVSYEDVSVTPDISVCIDCGDEGRFPKRKKLFQQGKKTICIDHHPTSEGICDLNYIDGSAGATGEIIFDLLKEMQIDLTKKNAEAIFAAITTDTGNFQYSNTTKKTHEIVTGLYDKGLENNKVSVSLYENETFEKIKLQTEVMGSAELIKNGRGAIAVVTQDMLKKCNAEMEDSEGLVSKLRSIKGVEVSMLLKESNKGVIKVAMRAKLSADVSEIAKRYGGGGHVKAAGCTIHDTIENVKKLMTEEIIKVL